MLKALVTLASFVALALALAVAACGDDDGSAAASRGPHVVATTTQAADLVRNVGGDRVEVTGLLAANADPHGYELRPRDVEALAGASLVVRSGGDLDEWLDEAIESSGTDADAITLMDSVSTIQGGHDEEVDPHWWQNPRNAVRAVAAIEAALAEADPAGKAQYAANAQRYTAEIQALDRAVAACWNDVPPARRKLVTTHDALGYYAERYGLEVIGTVIPSLSTQGQPSVGELAELAATIRAENVEVVFAESSVSSKVERAIADETGAAVGPALWADSLGPEGSGGATYLESIASNTRAMVDGVTGGEVSCALPGS